MQRRYGIPLMLGLLALSSWLSGYLPFNGFYVVVGLTAVWAAFDSLRIRIRDFDTTLALPPVGIAVALIVMWPIAFPWYLKIRYRIAHRLVGPRAERSARAGWIMLALIVTVATVAAIALSRPGSTSFQQLVSVATDLSAAYGGSATATLNRGRVLTITLTNPEAVSDSARRDRWLRSVAIFARERYARRDSLDTIAVAVSSERQQGAFTFSQGSVPKAWAVEQLGDTGQVAPSDDSLARGFLHMLRLGDEKAARMFEPGGVLERIGWDTVSTFARLLPEGRMRIELLHWDFLADSLGTTRLLSYRLDGVGRTAWSQLWIVDRGGKAYIGTVRIADNPRPAF